MKKLTSTLIISLSFVSFSCKKEWLDVKSNINLVVASSLSDYQAILDNPQINACVSTIGDISSDDIYINDASFLVASNEVRNAFTWTHSLPYLSGNVGWSSTYSNILSCNVVLEGLENIKAGSTAEKQRWNNIKGNALFLRSFYFFQLTQLWAPPYNSSTASNDLSIPLRLSSDVNTPSVSSTVAQTYSQIVSDLKIAKDLLPDQIQFQTRASRPAVMALLAKTYLCVADYVNSRIYADSALNIYNTLLDYNGLDTTASNPVSQLSVEVIFHCFALNPIRLSRLLVDSTLSGSYDVNDLRRGVFFKTNADGTIGFKGSYTGGNSEFIGLTVDELYLIRAECAARAGDKDSAMNDLNILLKKRWIAGNFVPYTAADASDALREILTERRKELLFRGIRWSDLKRLNTEMQFSKSVMHLAKGNSYVLRPNSFEYAIPIPDDVIQQTSLKQNQGW